jgi:hypothetical protein
MPRSNMHGDASSLSAMMNVRATFSGRFCGFVSLCNTLVGLSTCQITESQDTAQRLGEWAQKVR